MHHLVDRILFNSTSLKTHNIRQNNMNSKYQIVLEQETDGRWIAEIEALSGAMVYGDTREQAILNVEVLALRILADRLEHGESYRELDLLFAA
jgi:predicted RNase H-like HicB family nuclease